MQAQARGFGSAEETFDNFRFDGDEQYFQFTCRRRAKNLIIPNNFSQWKGHVLLGLVLDDLSDFGSIDRWQLDEFGKNVKAGRTDIGPPGAERIGCEQILDGFPKNVLPGGFLRTFQPERFDPKSPQQQCAGFINLKLSHLEAPRPKVETQK